MKPTQQHSASLRKQARTGWKSAFKQALKNQPDNPALWPESMTNAFDESEWQW